MPKGEVEKTMADNYGDEFDVLSERTSQQARDRDSAGKTNPKKDAKKGFDYKDHDLNPAMFEPTTGRQENEFSILPFYIKTDLYSGNKDRKPLMNQQSQQMGHLVEGRVDFSLELPLHRNVGDNRIDMVCLREAFGMKCFLCDCMFDEYKMRDNGEKSKEDADKMAKRFRPSWRNWYNIYNYITSEFEVWDDVSYHLFQKYLNKEAEKGTTDDPSYVNYSHPSKGSVLFVTGIEEDGIVDSKGNKHGFNKFAIIDFEPIKDPFSVDDIKQNISFDEIALDLVYSYEDMQDIYEEAPFEDFNKKDEPEKRNNSRRGNRDADSGRDADRDNRSSDRSRGNCSDNNSDVNQGDKKEEPNRSRGRGQDHEEKPNERSPRRSGTNTRKPSDNGNSDRPERSSSRAGRSRR